MTGWDVEGHQPGDAPLGRVFGLVPCAARPIRHPSTHRAVLPDVPARRG